MGYREEPVVRATWEYALADLIRSAGHARRKAHFHRALACLLGALGVISALVAFTVPTGSIPGSLSAMAGFTGLILFSMLRRANVEKRFRDVFGKRGRQHLELTEERFSLRDELGATSLAWDVMAGWEETEDDFYVYRDVGSYHLLPKRVFARPQDLVAARQLFTDRIAPDGPARIASKSLRDWVPSLLPLVLIALVFASIVEAIAR